MASKVYFADFRCPSWRENLQQKLARLMMTAGFGDIGYAGNWTMEIHCVQPVRVYPGMEICQIYYCSPVGAITKEYHGKYQGATDAVGSRLWQEIGGNQ